MDNVEIAPKRKRERSPSFPYLDLQHSIELAGKLFSDARMNEVRLSDAAASWDMSPKSGSLMRYVAALGQYGLLEASGGGEDRRYRISQSARRIFEDDRPGIREKLIAEAALKPKPIRDLFNGEGDAPLWGHDRPSDNIAESILKFDLNFTPDAAKRFLAIYDSAISRVVDGVHEKEAEDEGQPEALEQAEANQTPIAYDEASSLSEETVGDPARTEGSTSPTNKPTQILAPQDNFQEWFRARVGKEKTVTVSYSGSEEIGPTEIGKLIAMLEAQKAALED